MNHTPLSYRVEPFDPSGHRLLITLSIAHPDPAGQIVSLPAWIPGSYLIRDFSRHIESVTMKRDNRSVTWRKIDNHSWQAMPGDGALEISYVVYAWDLSVRGAHVDDTHAFFNGTSVFLRVHGQEQLPCDVTLVAPPNKSDWKVYTSLARATGAGAAREHGFGRYVAPDYDALLDHPVEMGRPQSIVFTAHGAKHELVFTGLSHDLDLARIAADVQKICEVQIAFFEPHTRRAPFLDSAQKYVFMTQLTPDGYGGLEHRASTALMAARRDLPLKGQAGLTEGYKTFLGLVSHEYFHTWHVKRIKPAVFSPYDLTQPNLTRLLWVFEGFTSYYDDLFLLRAGIIDETAYLQLLGKSINQVARGPGRHKQSLSDSSFDAWTRYYKQDENSPNAIVSYYTKGALAALGLDLTIRRATQDRYALDDVMMLLWQRFGRDFYKGAQQGVPEDAMPALILEATGVDVSRQIKQWVDGTTDVPLAELLTEHGIHLSWQANSRAPTLDIRTRKLGDSLIVANVIEHGAGHRGGLSAGDTLVAIEGLRVSAATTLDDVLSRFRPNTTVSIHVFRNDELHALRVRLRPAPPSDCVLTPFK